MRDLIATARVLRFTVGRRAPVGPVAQWLEPAAHNGLVAGSSPARPTNHSLDYIDFSAVGGFRRVAGRLSQPGAKNFGLTAGSFTALGPNFAPCLWRRFFSFRGRRRGSGRDRSSKRLRAVRSGVGQPQRRTRSCDEGRLTSRLARHESERLPLGGVEIHTMSA